jgi:hypothetical protein
MRSLIYAHKPAGWVGAVIELDHGKITSDDYVVIYRQFAARIKLKSHFDVCLDTLYNDQQRNRIWWSERLGQQGATFCLFVLPDIDPAAVARVRAHLRANRDVVAISSIRIKELIEFEPKL